MKIGSQVYVKNSIEAVEMYCRAFGVEITFQVKNEQNTAYAHCELSVDGQLFLAVSEATNPCDIDVISKDKWQTMTFNVFEMGSEDAVHKAFDFLSDGGTILNPIKEVPWCKCCATVIDKFGVCWWIAV